MGGVQHIAHHHAGPGVAPGGRHQVRAGRGEHAGCSPKESQHLQTPDL